MPIVEALDVLAEVPDAGHSVYFEQPDAFNQQIYAFLKTSARWRDVAGSVTAATGA